MAHTQVTKSYSQHVDGTPNTFSYSGSFEIFLATEVVVLLDDVALTYKTSIDNESASPRQYTVDIVAKTIHIGGGDLSSGTIIIKPSHKKVDTIPNIMVDDETYIPCKYDWSDLEEKIDYIMTNFNELNSSETGITITCTGAIQKGSFPA